MSWRTTKIEEIASVKGGKRLPKGHDFVSDPTEHLYIRARDIGNNRITLADAVYISDDTFNKIRNYTVSANDLVVTIVGANIGDVGFITNEYDGANLTENAARIRVNEKICDPRFLSFQISTPRAKEKFQLLTGGSAQGKLGLYKINAFDVVLPPIAAQRRVTSILTAYDDLIENNRRRIQLLEQAARLIYKEWFIHLRFPGHEHVKIKDGVPEGWEKKQVKELLAKIKRPGKIQKSDYLSEGSVPCVDQSKDFIGGYTDQQEAVIDQLPMIVFGDHTRILKFIDFPFACGADGTQLLYSSDTNLMQEYFFFSLDVIDLSNYFYARHFKFLKDQYIPRPPNMLIEQFTYVVRPVMKQIKVLRRQNLELAKARDLLLPRLMSGEIAA